MKTHWPSRDYLADMKYAIGIVLAVMALVGFSAMSSYNGFVSLQEAVGAEWSNVETQYQRRFDLIPNLVSTVQGAADFEKETLTAVTEARASAFNAMQAVGNGTGSIADFQQFRLRKKILVDMDTNKTHNESRFDH